MGPLSASGSFVWFNPTTTQLWNHILIIFLFFLILSFSFQQFDCCFIRRSQGEICSVSNYIVFWPVLNLCFQPFFPLYVFFLLLSSFLPQVVYTLLILLNNGGLENAETVEQVFPLAFSHSGHCFLFFYCYIYSIEFWLLLFLADIHILV